MGSLINLLGSTARNATKLASNIYDTLKTHIETSRIGNDSSFPNYYLKSFGNTYSYLGSGNISMLVKNKQFTTNTLAKNEFVEPNYDVDGAGPIPIGKLSNPYYNSDISPWYKEDSAHKATANYLSYILTTYFEGEGSPSFMPNMTPKEDQIASFNQSSLLLSNNGVASVRGYNKGEKRSKLGEMSNFYVSKTIENAAKEYEKHNNSISKGLYDAFKFGATYGITNDNSHLDSYTDVVNSATQVLAWSTTDHLYNSQYTRGTYGRNSELMDSEGKYNTSLVFDDLTRSIAYTTLYTNYANYYSLTYSHGLYYGTNEQTQGFIARSIYGYDLLDDDIDVELKESDNTNHTAITSSRYGFGKKYYPLLGGRGYDYISQIAETVDYVHKDHDSLQHNNLIRIQLNDVGNDNIFCANKIYTYAEPENKFEKFAPMSARGETFNGGARMGLYETYGDTNLKNSHDMIYRTNEDFLNSKYGTLIGRFHTPYDPHMLQDLTATAISKQYGMSHGRNLLKKNHKDSTTNGYSDPYCRVWTFHKQYATLNETIRPFDGKWGESEFATSRRPNNAHLGKWGVRGSNDMVKIAPTDGIEDIKKCMFSIENLAWKHEPEDSIPCKGPNGGRIMWFPPYDLSFSENVGVNWNANSFIGRGEKIYTYTDTERGGTLKFKLLIDHPSIVDTWKNDDHEGSPDTGAVDDVDSEEQTLLRFFAGCEILDVKHKDQLVKKVVPPENEPILEREPVEEPPIEEIEPAVTAPDDSLYFFVFFPNNYSGQNDKWDGEVKPMWYLANGVNGNYNDSGNGNIPTTLDTQYNGYEMRIENADGYKKCGNGITVGMNGSEPCTRGSTSNFGNTNFTDPNKTKYSCVYQDSKVKSAKNKWWYRVDNVTRGQHMHVPDNGKTVYDPWHMFGTSDSSINVNKNLLNYCDTLSYALNSQGYKRIFQIHQDMADKEEKVYSFADVFCAIEGERAKQCLGEGVYNDEKVEEIKALLKIYKASKIIYTGYASSQGYLSDNKRLAKQRGLSVKSWLANTATYKAKFQDASFECGDNAVQGQATTKTETGGNQIGHDNSELLAKIWRCVKIEIRLTQDTVTRVAEQNTDPDVDNVEKFDDDFERDARRLIHDYSEQITTANAATTDVKELTKGQNAVITNGVADDKEKKEERASMIAQKEQIDASMHDTVYDGYEYDESIYFKELERNKPFLHARITDKIQFFDPAFHSISPEGFNARLTFLHQCTRQGSTMSSSDGLGSRNMAFGAPPICVLRIGDFYNTRIVIESLNITYDNGGVQWDLNDEGIGVMPMMADVDISFKFLGGSDLGGPIKRLQNAVSFNYYANTSVYDRNAEYLPNGADSPVENVDNEENVE